MPWSRFRDYLTSASRVFSTALLTVLALGSLADQSLAKMPCAIADLEKSRMDNKKESETPERVVAQVTLYTRSGLSVLEAEEPLTTENLARYQVEAEVIDEARQKLTAYGFSVGPAGPHGFSISGEKAVFEKVFHTSLRSRTSEEEFVQGSYYEPTEPIRTPENLRGIVAGIALPSPPELFP